MSLESGWSPLYRYLVSLLVHSPPDAPFAFPLVPSSHRLHSNYWQRFREVEHSLNAFLDHFPHSSALFGAPGAGKSFALKMHVARSAAQLMAWLDDGNSPTELPCAVPLFVDLKEYSGDLSEQLHRNLPSEELKNLIARQQVSFVIDSFNEAPREFLESGQLRDDLCSWIEATPGCRWMIAARTIDGLDFLGQFQIEIGDLHEFYVLQMLDKGGFDLGQRHAEDLLGILRRPFFLKALLAKRMQLQPGGTHPAAAIESVVQSHYQDLGNAAGLLLSEPLGPLAAAAIESGHEILSKQQVERALGDYLSTTSSEEGSETRAMELLIRSGLFVQYDEQRISFYHQSLTEVVAARHVSKQIAENPALLETFLNSTNWDHALQLVFHYLNDEVTLQAFDRILKRDLNLAIKCTRFSEHQRHALVERVLRSLPAAENLSQLFGYDLSDLLNTLPIDTVHERILRELIICKDDRAGFAADLLARAIGEASVAPVLEAIFSDPSNINLGSVGGEAITPWIKKDAFPTLFERCCMAAQNLGDKESLAIYNLLRKVFEHQSPPTVVALYDSLQKAPLAIAAAFKMWLSKCRHPIRWKILVRRLVRREPNSTFELHLALDNGNVPSELFRGITEMELKGVVEYLSELIHNSEGAQFDLMLAVQLAEHHPRFAQFKQHLQEEAGGPLKIALLCLSEDANGPRMWDEVQECFADPTRTFTPREYSFLYCLRDLDWSGREDLFLKLIERRDHALVDTIVGFRWSMPDIKTPKPLSWEWLSKMLPFIAAQASYQGRGACNFEGYVLRNLDPSVTPMLVAEFNRADSPYREFLAKEYLFRLKPTVTSTDLTDESLEFLVERLRQIMIDIDYSEVLSNIATDDCVMRFLLPRLDDQTEPFHTNLVKVLRKIGKRLQKRYVETP